LATTIEGGPRRPRTSPATRFQGGRIGDVDLPSGRPSAQLSRQHVERRLLVSDERQSGASPCQFPATAAPSPRAAPVTTTVRPRSGSCFTVFPSRRVARLTALSSPRGQQFGCRHTVADDGCGDAGAPVVVLPLQVDQDHAVGWDVLAVPAQIGCGRPADERREGRSAGSRGWRRGRRPRRRRRVACGAWASGAGRVRRRCERSREQQARLVEKHHLVAVGPGLSGRSRPASATPRRCRTCEPPSR
jgi:hypothetical protein